ncbi:MAG: trehalose-phosphatase [Gammaproteobacteria bacterium]|nr:trehalose-phosphatase [Gammaproteobacteria bacterium]
MKPQEMNDHNLVISRDDFSAVIFNLDGVVTHINKVHAEAWKQTFDSYLLKRNPQEGEDLRPFHIDLDYRRYLDGKPRDAGIRRFLTSRHISLPWESPDSQAYTTTIRWLGSRKDQIFESLIQQQGIEVYGCAIALIHQLRNAGIKTAVISASKHCDMVLERASIQELFDARIDAVESERLDLGGKPDPYVLLELARRLGTAPERTAVIEDSVIGVTACSRGRFGLIIGFDDGDRRKLMLEHGADYVVDDLCSLLVDATTAEETFPVELVGITPITNQLAGKRPVLFLDYGGTLTPVLPRSEDVRIPKKTRRILRKAARLMPVTLVSGRDVEEICAQTGLHELCYAGSHGLDIRGRDIHLELPEGDEALQDLDRAMEALTPQLGKIPGVTVGRKRFAIVVHYPQQDADSAERVATAIKQTQALLPRLKITGGKEVFELLPAIDWDKGRAMNWLLSELGLDSADVLPIYIGDDVTDEAAFLQLRDKGIGILVADRPQPSAASFRVNNPEEVLNLLKDLVEFLDKK